VKPPGPLNEKEFVMHVFMMIHNQTIMYLTKTASNPDFMRENEVLKLRYLTDFGRSATGICEH